MPQPDSQPVIPELIYPDAPEALERLRPTLMAIPPDRVRPVRANVPTAVANLLQVARSFSEDSARMAAAFTKEGFDPTRFENVVDRAQAYWQADVDLRIALDPKRTLPPLVKRGKEVRGELLEAASYLWSKDPEIGPRVEEICAGSGHIDMADDLMALSSLLAENWEEARGRCKVEEQDLTTARQLATKVLAVTRMARTVTETDALRDLRDRAATYALEAANEIRAAAAFIHRHEPDPLDGYPGIFSGKRRAKKSVEVTQDAPASPPEVSDV